MKKLIFWTIFFVSTVVNADCSVPDLKFESHNGNISGFKVIKLWDGLEAIKVAKKDIILKFGDYDFLLSPVNTNIKPVKLNSNIQKISQTLLNNFKSSPHYLDSEVQSFSVSDIEVYDLTGDSKENLIFFHVSPGANVYSGTIAVIEEKWKTHIEPTCY